MELYRPRDWKSAGTLFLKEAKASEGDMDSLRVLQHYGKSDA